MAAVSLSRDPFSIIITGVGGQGNVLASRLLGSVLSSRGFLVTIGETFGASQRGGSVMSHLRISKDTVASPQIPRGRADVIVSLEPAEALRVLADYGNPEVVLLTNTHPIYPVGVIKGELEYPPVNELKEAVARVLPASYFIDATDLALSLGNSILANIVMLGALSRLAVIPFGKEDFLHAITQRMAPAQIPVNMRAFEEGYAKIMGSGI